MYCNAIIIDKYVREISIIDWDNCYLRACENNQIDVRKKGHKWQGWEEAEKDFEIRLLKDYC